MKSINKAISIIHKKIFKTTTRPLAPLFFEILVTNICNMKCFSCSTLCDKPFGTNSFRDEPYKIEPNDLNIFLRRLRGLYPEHWVRLEGGEPTLLDYKTMMELCKICYNNDRKVDILTNGYRLKEYDPYWFDAIILDDHGTNHQKIIECKKFLESNKYRSYYIHNQKFHYDLDYMRKNNITLGQRCPEWMNTISLYKQVVYPCCVMCYLDGWSNELDITEDLRKASFTISNPDLGHYLKNWRKYLPNSVYKMCSIGCWRDSKNIKKIYLNEQIISNNIQDYVPSNHDNLITNENPISSNS